MIAFSKLQEVLNDQIEFTAHEVAALFCELNSHQMATFFNKVAMLSDKWHGTFSQQMQYVKDSPMMDSEGLFIMQKIGEYGND